ncbi:WD40 repeat domain-containing serine/threonine protein kinase [Nocardiopsis nanhaiensis]
MKPLAPSDPDRIGPHRLLARLGAGGMGHVYLARSPDGRLAAVKVVHAELSRNTEFRARFDREIRVAQRVQGPFTPTVVAAGPDEDTPWMATEYVPGPTLSEALRENGPFPEDSLRVLALGLARALRSVHAAGLMHRDLKPGNVLLSPRGPQVIDFGIARAVEGTVLTKTGQSFGTPTYAAPETVLGREQSAASDVFSLAGVVVYAAGGRPPFGTGPAPQVLHRVVSGEPGLGALPEGALRDLLARCLAKEPRERPDAAEIIGVLSAGPLPSAEHGWLPDEVSADISDRERELDRVMAAVPVAPPEQPVPTAPKRRRVALVAGTAVAAAVLLAGAGLAAVRPWEGDPNGTADEAAGETSDEGAAEGAESGEGSTNPSHPDLPGAVETIRFSPDGDTVYVLTGESYTAWDWREGEPLDPGEGGIPGTGDRIPASFDVSADGIWGMGTQDGVRVWPDGEEADQTRTSPETPGSGEPHVSVSLADERTRAAFVQEGPERSTATVWDWGRGDEGVLMETEIAHDPGESVEVLMSPDGTRVAVARLVSRDPGVAVLEVDSGETVVELPGDGDPPGYTGLGEAYIPAFAPDSSLVALHHPGLENVTLHDLASGETTAELETPESIDSLSFTHDGSALLSGGAYNGGRKWDAATGEELTSGNTLLHDRVTVHPDGETIVVAEEGTRGSHLVFLDPETLLDTHTVGGPE